MSRTQQLIGRFKNELEGLLSELHQEAELALGQRQYARLESIATELRAAEEVLSLLASHGSLHALTRDLAIVAEEPAIAEQTLDDKPKAVALPEPPVASSEAPQESTRIEPPIPLEDHTEATVEPDVSLVATNKEASAVEKLAPAPGHTKPEETPKPKHLVCPQGQELDTLRKQFFSDSRDLMEAEDTNSDASCLLKSNICLGWFLYYTEQDKPVKDTICEEVRCLADFWKLRAGDFFFGIDKKATVKPENWHAFYRSFRFLHFAKKAIDLMSSETVKGTREIYELIAYCETSLYRLIVDLGLNYYDKDQQQIHKWLEKSPFTPYQCWKPHADGGPKTETVFEHASELEPIVTQIETTLVKKASRDELLKAIATFVNDPQNFESFGENLKRLVVDCLNGGIPPSNTSLRELLAPFRAEVEGLEHNHAKKLLEYLEKDANKALVKKLVPVEIDVPEDPEHEHRLTEVKKILKDKHLLIVGGNKGQAHRIEDLRKKLGLKLLEWPPTEEHTRNDALEDHVARADAVCIAVRWARHSRKDLLDIAKAQGKMTAILPRGTGFNKIVYDLYGQWCNGNGRNNHHEDD